MSESPTNAPVQVTGEPWLHPAYRKLARAFIALARLQLADPPPSEASSKPVETQERQEDGV